MQYLHQKNPLIKKSGILNLEIKNKPNKTNNSKNTKNLILDENGKNINTMDLVEMIKTLNNNRIESLNFYIGKPEGFSNNYEKYEKISLRQNDLSTFLSQSYFV